MTSASSSQRLTTAWSRCRGGTSKFRRVEATRIRMKSVGEVMSIGRTFEEAIQKVGCSTSASTAWSATSRTRCSRRLANSMTTCGTRPTTGSLRSSKPSARLLGRPDPRFEPHRLLVPRQFRAIVRIACTLESMEDDDLPRNSCVRQRSRLFRQSDARLTGSTDVKIREQTHRGEHQTDDPSDR